ncbi:MAG: class II fructose-bisphosphate aldolase [candidate division Zixibacteria bacterium]|jgi:fructose-bisphosphate aldolase class II|nr:class II fructose-bisphosphate aldolase [candidate division Zixibacteria bacterium]
MSYAKLLDKRYDSTKRKLGAKSKVCLLSGRDIFDAIRDQKMIMMACNIRIKHVVPGIMRAAQELDAIVGFELAKTEGNLDGGYTGQNPQSFFEMLVDYAERINFTMPFFIHGDHITVKNTSEKEIESARNLIAAELEAGYTSFCVDASFNPLEDNVRITTMLAKPIVEAGWGLESEVGEISSAGQEAHVTTVKEATDFIDGILAGGIKPNLLAINNGSKHGNYLEGEEINIDLKRTGEIAEAIAKHNIRIAQHGITGTPPHILQKFADYGIRKGNVGTEWQNIAHRNLPPDLLEKMKEWSKNNNKNIKEATKPFKAEIDGIPSTYADAIASDAYLAAKEFLTAFRAVGSAAFLNKQVG